MKYISTIVTFNPNENLNKLVSALLEQGSQVIIVDNGSELVKVNEMKRSLQKLNNVRFIFFKENEGIAKALNEGLSLARKLNYEWCFTFDQDSLINEGYIRNIEYTSNKFDSSNIAIIGPNQTDISDMDKKTKFLRISRFGWNWIYADEDIYVSNLITSGCYTKIKTHEEIGGFDESLFIDQVDTDYCIKCLIENYKILVCHKAVLFHKLGEQTSEKKFGREMRPTHHNELRRYYMFRNSIYLYKKYFFKKNIWVMFDINNNLRSVIKILFFERNRIRKFKMIFKGIKDGVFNKMGKLLIR